MRLCLPALALVLVALVVSWSHWQQIESGFRIGFSAIHPDEAKSLRMVNPRFAGTNDQSRPFMVTADEARRASRDADTIYLTNPKGDIVTEGGAWVALTAAAGVYARDRELLDLEGGVDLFHDKGLHFVSPTARIDLKGGTAEGNDPVIGSGPSIDITGQGFRILEGGKRVIFTGKSKAVLYPSDTRERKNPPKRQGR
ncbi:MAG: LPS export ABC transporter periplasmic protein LptC [Alphaproteobacteria bacterium]|nr:LPS export ABC transporter periplasmic protein LptC [Alphaproteobacteria bacterium]